MTLKRPTPFRKRLEDSDESPTLVWPARRIDAVENPFKQAHDLQGVGKALLDARHKVVATP